MFELNDNFYEKFLKNFWKTFKNFLSSMSEMWSDWKTSFAKTLNNEHFSTNYYLNN
jgi:hypothetical protein